MTQTYDYVYKLLIDAGCPHNEADAIAKEVIEDDTLIAAQCDCCGRTTLVTKVIAFGIDTLVCEECRNRP